MGTQLTSATAHLERDTFDLESVLPNGSTFLLFVFMQDIV